MIVLALDLGLKTGYAIGDLDGTLHASGTIDLERPRKKTRGAKFADFLDQLDRWLKPTDGTIDVVAYEYVPRHRGTAAAHVYGALEVLVHIGCYVHDISDLRSFTAGQVKKAITGRGDAEKLLVMRAACDRFGVHDPDDNEADALAVLCAVIQGAQ